jgi:uncharacterized protein YktA (UPF0223 family)
VNLSGLDPTQKVEYGEVIRSNSQTKRNGFKYQSQNLLGLYKSIKKSRPNRSTSYQFNR